MNIVLRRRIRVRCAHVVGRVAFPMRRVAEHAVVVWAAERLSAGLDASAEMLCEAEAAGPLLGLSKVVGVRLVHVCQELGLLQRDRNRIVGLTPEGERVARSAEPRVFVPQLGPWSIFWAEDPLLRQPLLRIEPWKEPTAHDEQAERRARRGKQGEGEKPQRPFRSTPRLLLDLCDQQGESPPLELPASKDGAPVRLVSLEERAELVQTQDELVAELAFTPGVAEGSLRLRGSVAGKSVDRTLPPLPGWNHAQIWWELLCHHQIEEFWNARTGQLRVQFTTLRDDARKSFRLRLPFKAPDIEGLGPFEDTAVEKIPIEPATQDDAQRWFEWLLADRATETQWPETYMRNVTELRKLFSGFELGVPGQGELARSIRGAERPRPAFWHLQATLDLDGGIR
jgi:hypothetical protein